MEFTKDLVEVAAAVAMRFVIPEVSMAVVAAAQVVVAIMVSRVGKTMLRLCPIM